ncbi:MAG: alpha-amylase family glycosyl hydrolase [bacterium]
MLRKTVAVAVVANCVSLLQVRGEVILQYFNTSYREMADRMPELAEVGYGSIWLPPPTKGSGGASVGYDCWDPFDLGGKDQRSSIRTRYGTEAELLRLIETAHRFGIRVYFDNIMNHRAFDVPGYNENTPIDVYPGLVPEDFHLRVTEDGFYRKWDNVANWNDSWQVQYRNFSDLIDIAQEDPNGNFGRIEGGTFPKVKFVRTPNHPEFYDFHPTLGRVGFYSTNITVGLINSNQSFYSENLGTYMMRSVRWLVDHTKVDGLRLDAVKHVPSYFFGQQSGAGKDESSAGYCGQAQEQFNITRGFSDSNHRDTCFDVDLARDDLMMFGEHLGKPPGFQEYIDAGMRLVDSQLKGELNYRLGNPSASLAGLDAAGWSGDPAFNQYTAVMFAKSHDDDYVSRPELHFALHLTRQGLANMYTDGNYQSETLGQSGGAFPRHANTAYLGQFSDNRIPNLVYINSHFSRGSQIAKWSDGDVVAYERRDKRENGGMSDLDGTVMLFMMNDNYSAGQGRAIDTTFPHQGGTSNDAYLYNYSSYGGGFYTYASAIANGSVIISPGGYFVFSWRTPEESDLWTSGGGKPVTFYQNGVLVTDVVAQVRKDGPAGDPAFNPYGLTDPTNSDYQYTMYLPRVTEATNLRFIARVDGSAANVMLKLDGGWDINSQMGLGETNPANYFYTKYRDNRPADLAVNGTEMYLGYEQAAYHHRQYKEKFAAEDSNRNKIGSGGAETYECVIGTSGLTINQAVSNNDFVSTETASWVYHEPDATITASNHPAQAHFNPAPTNAAGSNITVWVKIGYGCTINNAFLYYTTDGSSYPEGAGGEGMGATKTAQMTYQAADQSDGTIDWWKGTIPAQTNGTILRYKVGVYKQQGGACGVGYEIVFPTGASEVSRKKSMMGVWEITGFNARTNVHYPHVDYGLTQTGLVEGLHVLSARAFLERSGRAALYNTFVQPFYFDTMTPTGRIVYPGSDGDDLQSQEYGVVVRTDPTVRDVMFNIMDSDTANDDANTGVTNGNGPGAWARAYFETPSLDITNSYPDQWRFTYRNIPASGVSTMSVRLLELSSSTNMALTDTEGHFTTLARLADAMAPTQQLYVAYPEYDGEQINDAWDYIMKTRFSKSMDSNVTNFLIRINGSAQPQSAYSIDFSDGSFNELRFTLPDLYNGDSDFVHQIQVIYTSNGGVQYQANRYIRASAQASGPYVAIVSPPEVDSDGQPYVITLPDLASPTPEQRQVPILVETDVSGLSTWIEFANGSGIAGLVASTETAVAGLIDVTAGTNLVVGRAKSLTGTVIVIQSNQTVTGTGTLFTNELRVGETIRVDTNNLVITQIVSQTSIGVGEPYPGASATGLSVTLMPRFDVDFQAGSTIRLNTNTFTVSSVLSTTNLLLNAAYPGPSSNNMTAYRIDPNPVSAGTRKRWTFLWTNIMTQGTFTFYARVDTNGVTNTVEASATRNVTVEFREMVADSAIDLDDDDDGLYDFNELTATSHPSAYRSNSDEWQNGDQHVFAIYGKTDPLSPNSDGDGLPDGLESGWRSALSDTATNVDTDGDGFPNFRSDLDPPFWNTLDNYGSVPGVTSASDGGDRNKLVQGTLTDPNNPDTDYDGIPDGIEDRNRNGWVDGDGLPLDPLQDAGSRTNWPDRQWDSAWTETDPNAWDTDGDSGGDGVEDADKDGVIDGDTNSNRVREASEAWSESNPLNPDTDGDGLPDGWELQYGFDPLDDGTDSMRTTNLVDGSAVNGPGGNPDGDTYVVGIITNAYSNIVEYANGTNPRLFDSSDGPATGSITIGRGPAIGVVNGVTNYQEFTDWAWDDLIVLDEYEGDGPNNQGGDLYPAYDGYDSSRDIVAFYARDGGAIANEFYFRVDFHDLTANAEDANLDIYVVIDTGSETPQGEKSMPRYETEEPDLVTSNLWEAAIVVDSNNKGSVFVDLNRTNNTTSEGQNPASFGVVERNQATANGFLAAHFNAELDAVEFSISRQALLDAGWNGLSISSLNFQVFSTRDGTCNSCNGGQPGAGDIGGRNDVRDSIYDDNVAEDYWQNQSSVPNALGYWFNKATFAGRAKVAMVAHGNQAIQPGNIIQNLINNGSGAGYQRVLDVHELYGQPFGLHVTPTLASAMQWARADTNLSPAWRDGALFNARMKQVAATNVLHVFASTFSDHMLPYFTPDYNQDNQVLSKEFLGHIYGVTFDTNSVFWTPERVLDADVFSKILAMGYQYTLVDQDTHLFTWLGRTTSLGDGGYRINRINGVNCFVINNDASNYRFQNNDNGLNMPLRGLFNRKARSGTQDQVVTLLSNWEDFGSSTQADAYDVNIRWIANHPWVQLVAFDDITRQQVDLGGDGVGDAWTVIDRGNVATNKLSHNYIQHAARGNVDNWYVGLTNLEEGLQQKVFEIRPGTNVNRAYGMMYLPGAVTDAWAQVNSISDTNLGKLGRGALHASSFETAFHDEGDNDLTRFSIGTYVSPDSAYDALAGFSKQAQAQARIAALYERVDDWAAVAASMTNVQTDADDFDLDGEFEYALYNDRLFAVFESIGGRMIGAWVRDILAVPGRVYQALGNQIGFAGSETEVEGAYNVDTNASGAVIIAYRTSGLKDWYMNGSIAYNNDLYSVVNWTNGWRLTSGDGNLRKTVTLAPKAWQFEVSYALSGALSNQALYVRHGLSPDLYNLLLDGQRTLDGGTVSGGVFRLANTNYEETVVATVGFSDAGHNAGINMTAVDDDASKGVSFYTVNMRNQAQTHQVELVGTNTFSFSLGFRAVPSDYDGDGMPNTFEGQYSFNPSNMTDGATDQDGDGVRNADEYLAGTAPNDGQDFLRSTQAIVTNNAGIIVRFPSKAQRDYTIWYVNEGLVNPSWLLATSNAIPGTGGTITWTDDGAQTAPAPALVTNRFYRINAGLPQ